MDFNKYEDAIFKNAMECFADTAVVVYSADIKQVHSQLDIGCIQYNIKPIYMINYNGDQVLEDIKSKIENNTELTNQDIMKLTFVPIMSGVKHKAQRAIESIELAKSVKDEHQRLQSIAMLYAFVEKFGDEETKKKFKEVFAMTEVGRMLLEEGMEKGIEKGMEKGMEKGREEGKTEMLVAQLTAKFKSITKADIESIKKLPTEKLSNIAIKIFDIASLEELRTYFD